ncbi:helix-turn-helix domain-containing protein [Chryseolinea lacunae]|uniref:Helix-turn-helix transcriptional regulator n=1 Tax=Chryseolinea lacunae TaxID=2801331 RepID=A0ABS1L507_9BACT|nr:AraC family transcriptional regulator [Chryseolinea lacunae]MBL0745641.1 helix-turn-helix transcriptional regulator [Chryseolinea lacunae]
MHLAPADILKPFIKSYSVVTLEKDLTNEVFYPSGYVDLAINISNGKAATIIDGHRRDMPDVEVLGQLTVPTRLTVAEGTSVLLARIQPHANALFLPPPASDFTNYAVDMQGVFANESREFYEGLVHAGSLDLKIKALDAFLIQKLRTNEKMHRKANVISQLCDAIVKAGESFDLRTIANTYGLSTRYIQQLFLDVVGLTPRAFFSLQRFNKSVNLVLSSNVPLTTIAYDCGYYDQAHFIREFKKFTGITPSEARPSLSEGGVKFQQAVNIGL